MSVRDQLRSGVSRAAHRLADAPVRRIAHSVVAQHGVAVQAEIDRIVHELEVARSEQRALAERLMAAESMAARLEETVSRLQQDNDDLQRDLADAREQTMDALSRADAADASVAQLRKALGEDA